MPGMKAVGGPNGVLSRQDIGFEQLCYSTDDLIYTRSVHRGSTMKPSGPVFWEYGVHAYSLVRR